MSELIKLSTAIGPLGIFALLVIKWLIERQETRNGSNPTTRLEAAINRQTETLALKHDKQTEAFQDFYREFSAHRALMEKNQCRHNE